jgi:hypothetical protein
MFCRDAHQLTSSYLDRQLDLVQVRIYEEHIFECDDCRDHLDLLKQIPAALQTDRMLAPKPEFTTLVMQRIIVKQQFGNSSSTFEAQFTSLSYTQSVQDEDDDFDLDEDDDEEENAESDLTSTQVQPISMAEFARDRQVNRAGRVASNYVLRFSSVAAALVMMVGVSVYALGNFGSTPVDAPTAAVYGSIKDFADNLRNAFSSPLELAAGVAISAVILISLWYLLRSVRTNNEINNRSKQNVEAETRR